MAQMCGGAGKTKDATAAQMCGGAGETKDAPAAQMCGSVGETKDATADEDMQDLCASVRNKVEEIMKRKFPWFTAVSYRSQVVAGTNFFVKVFIGNEEYVHVRIHQPLPHMDKPASLVAHQEKKTELEEIVIFG